MGNPTNDNGNGCLSSVKVNYYEGSSKSCQSKISSSANLIQPFLDRLQDRFGLPRIMFNDMGDTGGASSTDEKLISNWWFEFFKDQPPFWFSLRQSNGKEYAVESIKRYMPAIHNQLKKKFLTSRYLSVITSSFKSSKARLDAMVKGYKISNPGPPKTKVYSRRDITFILERCLWMNTKEFLDFFVFQTALLRLCSRASETSRLSTANISICEVQEGSFLNSVLQVYFIRDKKGADGNNPLIPNRDAVFLDLTVAIGISLFIYDDDCVMPSVACLSDSDSAVSGHYTKMRDVIFKRYPPPQGDPIKKGTSHFGKHTTQFQLDGLKLHIAAQLFGGWKVGEGARPVYFSNPFPYLLEGAKALSCWQKADGEYQPVVIPPYKEQELGDRVREAFFGHRCDVSSEIKQMVLICVLAKWDKLIDVIQAEPAGQFKNPRNHIIYSTLLQRLSQAKIELTEFNTFKCACEDLFNDTNRMNRVHHQNQHQVPPPVIKPPPPTPQTQSLVSPEYIPTPIQSSLNIRPLAGLVDQITRSRDIRVILISYFACNFMDSYTSAPPPAKSGLYHRYQRIKRPIGIMVRFLDSYPHTLLSLEAAGVAVNRIKTVLLSDPSKVKHQGKGDFKASTSLCLSIIDNNKSFLTDKSKPWYRPVPSDTPYQFIEHMFSNKQYNI